MKEIEPLKVLPGESKPIPPRSRLGLALSGGELGREVSPLPFATSRNFPSGVGQTALGYQPVGRKPSTTAILVPRSFASSERLPEISTTITSLLSALATNNVLPSVATATPQGVLPSG